MTDQEFNSKMFYFNEMQEAANFETVWSIYEADSITQQILQDRTYRVCYTFIDGNASTEEIMNDEAWVEVSSFATSGKLLDLWAAAESCFQQAKQKGDFHKFIESFDMREDGSLEITMGS